MTGTHSQAGSANPQPRQAVYSQPGRKVGTVWCQQSTVIPAISQLKAQPRQAVLVPPGPGRGAGEYENLSTPVYLDKSRFNYTKKFG